MLVAESKAETLRHASTIRWELKRGIKVTKFNWEVLTTEKPLAKLSKERLCATQVLSALAMVGAKAAEKRFDDTSALTSYHGLGRPETLRRT